MSKAISIKTGARQLAFLLLSGCLTFAAQAQQKGALHMVEARKNADDPEWKSYGALTVDALPGFNTQKKEPALNQYGAWKTDKRKATGFFRTEKVGERWWIIDPEGYPFIHKGVAVFKAGDSDRQQQKLREKFKTAQTWAQEETKALKAHGFNGAGAWSEVDLLRQQDKPLVYSVIVSPMGRYRAVHKKRFGGEYKVAGWQGYRFDLAMVFDPEFDQFVEDEIKSIAKYKDDKFLLGYYTDNELPWWNDALDRHLTLLAKDEAGYLAARKWLDERKGTGTSLESITDEDRRAFTGYYFETYLKKVTAALKKYDPNHLYLGCRFNQDKQQELTNPEIFRVAGKYMDIISINHYRKWEPDQALMANWANWSGKPFLITEWYTKGEDSGLPNQTGAGWNVRTQADRGYFYQNFTLGLLQNKSCVGWHWFKYQDNDPQNLKTDPSNRDSNKGMVDSDFNKYQPLWEAMANVNQRVYNLIRYFDKK